jgi:nucleotide-binding universal stress UspA family protein
VSAFARILVGIDGTDWGFEALRQALLLSPAETSVVQAVTALDTAPAIHAGMNATHLAEMLTREAAEARDAAEKIMGSRPGSARVVRGKPVPVLRRERDELNATLVVFGGRRSSRFLGIMLGDTGTELLHDAVCSVLLARPTREETWRPRRIVVGLDSSIHALAALSTADELAGRLGGSVEVVSATGGKAIDRDPAWADRVQSWDPANAARALIQRSHAADLIVVGSRGVHGVRALGSVSERVAHQAHCTVLVIHEPTPQHGARSLTGSESRVTAGTSVSPNAAGSA